MFLVMQSTGKGQTPVASFDNEEQANTWIDGDESFFVEPIDHNPALTVGGSIVLASVNRDRSLETDCYPAVRLSETQLNVIKLTKKNDNFVFMMCFDKKTHKTDAMVCSQINALQLVTSKEIKNLEDGEYSIDKETLKVI